jgi:DNA phosphorothioation-dependent restriction protein DptG
MHVKFLADLQEIMQKFLDEHCEEDEWPDSFCHPELSKHMAQAASTVYDATFASSKYTEKECVL